MDGFGSAKRPLTEVKEEPPEKDDDYEMVDGSEMDQDNDRKSTHRMQSTLAEQTYCTCFPRESYLLSNLTVARLFLE